MSVVENMQQKLRTVAAGGQNQDPNKTVYEKELTPKKFSDDDVENSIHEVLSHSKNSFGRGRQPYFAELHKNQAAENSPLEMSPLSGNKLLGGSANKSEVGVAPVEQLLANNLSTSDTRKRRLCLSSTRAPLSVLNTEDESENNNCTDCTVGSPVKTEGTFVYSKRQKTGSSPLTPPLRSSLFRRRGAKEVSPPPGFESCSSDMRIETTTEASPLPMPEQDADAEAEQLVNLEPMSPSIAEDENDPYGFNSVRGDLEESNALVLWSEPETPVHEVEDQSFSLISQSSRKAHGLMNLGNTCYMNVIIQCLYNLPSFLTGLERFFGPLVNENAFEDMGTLFSSDVEIIESVHTALLRVFHDLKRAERYDSVNPSALKDAFAKRQSSFWGCIQQDAHEFFCSLIDQVQEEVSSELKKQYRTDADRPKLEIVCPTTQNFSCLVRNNLTCTGCGNTSSVEETYRDFCLALPEDERIDESQNCSLESLLNLYFQETTMSRKCQKCGCEDTKAQAEILKLPHVLVLQLKRLHMDRDVPCTKVSAPVKFNSHLDIGPFCAQEKQKFWSPTLSDALYSASRDSSASTCTTASGGSLDWGSFTSSSDGSMNYGTPSNSNCLELPDYFAPSNVASPNVSTCYKLYGVVNHLGCTASAGHFLADVLDPEADTWLRCDDSTVSDISEDSVFANEREAYMFFYVHEPVTRTKEKLD